MENKEIDLILFAKGIWAKKRKLIKWSCIGLILGIIVAFSIPKQYETVVKIAPESKSENSSLGSMGGLAAIAGIDVSGGTAGLTERIYPEIISSTPFMLEFADMNVEYNGKKMNLYKYITEEQKRSWWRYVIAFPGQAIGWVRNIGSSNEEPVDTISIFHASETQNNYVSAMRSMITAEVDKKAGIITIKTKMQDPLISALVADSLLSKLQWYMNEYYTSKARYDLESSETMLAKVKQEYYDAETAYAAARDRNQNLNMESARVKLDRLANEKNLAFTIYQQLATQVEMNRIKLQEVTPIATVIEPASVPLKPVLPNKRNIAIAFAFLGAFAATAVVIVKLLLFKREDEQ